MKHSLEFYSNPRLSFHNHSQAALTMAIHDAIDDILLLHRLIQILQDKDEQTAWMNNEDRALFVTKALQV